MNFLHSLVASRIFILTPGALRCALCRVELGKLIELQRPLGLPFFMPAFLFRMGILWVRGCISFILKPLPPSPLPGVEEAARCRFEELW